jgi:hypothetical protein
VPEPVGWTGRTGVRRQPAGYAAASQQSTTAPRQPTGAPREGATARALLDRVIAAKGGLEKLRALKTIKALTSATMSSPQGKVEAETTTYLQYPNRVRVETKLPDATTVQIFDGQHAWVRDPSGIHDVPEPMLRGFAESLRRDTISLLVGAVDGTVHARLMPDVRDDKGTVQHALEFSSQGLDPVIMYVAPDTHLITKQTYLAGGPARPLVEERFSDYRIVDGIQIAYMAAVQSGGQPIVERRINDIRINLPIDPALFKRPSS